MTRGFDHERLNAYREAIEFVEIAEAIIRGLPPGRMYLGDQLQRAASSIALNIAEGAGEFRPLEKVRFYRMAQRSATECASIVELLLRRRAVRPEVAVDAENRLKRVVPLVIGLCKSHERAAKSQARPQPKPKPKPKP